jgi:hypothetical protein
MLRALEKIGGSTTNLWREHSLRHHSVDFASTTTCNWFFPQWEIEIPKAEAI